MGIYDSRIVYPPEADEIDVSECEECNFNCDVRGYCKKEKKYES